MRCIGSRAVNPQMIAREWREFARIYYSLSIASLFIRVDSRDSRAIPLSRLFRAKTKNENFRVLRLPMIKIDPESTDLSVPHLGSRM